MNISLRPVSAIFKDRATLIIREMMRKENKRWSVRELAAASGTSIGLVSRVLGLLNQLGLIEGGGRGRYGFTTLKDVGRLLEIWTTQYDFSLNKVTSFYSPDEAAPKKIISFLKSKGIHHALTLHCGANLLTNYFSGEEHHIYVDIENINKLAEELSANIILKRLASGGNIHFIKPYYKASAYYKARVLRGVDVVSNLQLYLDLYRFVPRGNEHAAHLMEKLGNELYE